MVKITNLASNIAATEALEDNSIPSIPPLGSDLKSYLTEKQNNKQRGEKSFIAQWKTPEGFTRRHNCYNIKDRSHKTYP